MASKMLGMMSSRHCLAKGIGSKLGSILQISVITSDISVLEKSEPNTFVTFSVTARDILSRYEYVCLFVWVCVCVCACVCVRERESERENEQKTDKTTKKVKCIFWGGKIYSLRRYYDGIGWGIKTVLDHQWPSPIRQRCVITVSLRGVNCAVRSEYFWYMAIGETEG